MSVAVSPRVTPMTPSTSANVGPAAASEFDMTAASSRDISPMAVVKRKAEDDIRSLGKENGPEKVKKAKVEASVSEGILDVAKRKINFSQPVLNLDIPRRLKLAFEGFLLDAQDAKQEITEIPEDHWKYITLAGVGSTQSTEAALVTSLRKTLEPSDLSNIITSTAWTDLVPKLFKLEQYGVLASDFPSSSSPSSTRRIPASLQIRSWASLKPEYFTSEQQAILAARQNARIEARRQVEVELKAMDDVELHELLKGEKGKDVKESKEKKRIKPITVPAPDATAEAESSGALPIATPSPRLERKTREGTAASGISLSGSRRSASPVKKAMTEEEIEAARIKAEEKEAKRIALEEKKAAKEEKRLQREKEEAAKEDEKKRKEALLSKQKQAMSSFFKPKIYSAPKKPVAGPSKPSDKKDFDRMFKPVAMRPNVDWAPVNRFRMRRPSDQQTDDSDDPLGSFVSRHRKTRGSTSKTKLRTDALYGTVGEKWEEYQNSPDPRAVARELANTRRFPWKVLAFDEQTRPPYCGTFTKRSVVVGPRTPFAQDPLFDYSYDSGDDWCEDEGGDDVDGDEEPEAEFSDEDAQDSESDGEFDDWLDDGEEVGQGVDGGFGDDDVVMLGKDGEQTKIQMKQAVKRKEVVKKVVKVQPYVKGPCFESQLGKTDGLDTYRIQLLNDTPSGIDPFTYTAPEPIQTFKTTYTTTSVGHQLSVKTLMLAEPINAIMGAADPFTTPADQSTTPSRPNSLDHPGVPGPTHAHANGTTTPFLSRRAPPKVLFPDSHLAELLNLIEGSTKIRTDLISQLKAHFEGTASKAAIEVKLKEVAEREGKTKDSAWRVADAAWMAAGLTPPVRVTGSLKSLLENGESVNTSTAPA